MTARSERAFYHFLPDEYLARLARGEIGDEHGIHLPRVPRGMPGDGSLDEQLGGLLAGESAPTERPKA